MGLFVQNKENDETEALLKKENKISRLSVLKSSLVILFTSILLLCVFYLLYVFKDGENQLDSSETMKLGGSRFYVDYNQNEFIKDGKVFRYVSGSLHYFRVPRPYWRDRIRKMRFAGLNTISFYIEWSFHEPHSGIYNFEGQADLEHFLRIINEENMTVLIRPGPFISAERDFGGHPYWLLKEEPSIQLRSSDPNYKKYVKRWFSVLLPKLVPFLYGNGGNIIMVQIENEFGHNGFEECDKEYILWLRDLVHHYVNNQALLYTTDECNLSYMKCGHIPNVYSTIDFGSPVNETECFDYMRKVQKRGPLVNSEFYIGWIAFWNESRPIRSTKNIIHKMKNMLALNASFNIFLFHGGTNFGFTSGANFYSKPGYKPQLTSYDFTAPLDEAGDPTEKYYAIKQALKEANFPTFSTPKCAPKGNYGNVNLVPVISLLDHISLRIKPIVNDVPLSFEDMDQNHGLVLYETNLQPTKGLTELPLVINGLHDRAIVFLDNVKLGILSRSYNNTKMNLKISGNYQKLSILVEDQGRVNDKTFLKDRKGILSNVTLGKHILKPWMMVGYPLNNTAWLFNQNIQPDVQPPAFYRGVFVVPQNKNPKYPLDTYLDTSGWSKGVAFINEINIGRYWPAIGPQITLFIPAPYLIPGLNTIVLVEFEKAPENFTVKLTDKPRLDW